MLCLQDAAHPAARYVWTTDLASLPRREMSMTPTETLRVLALENLRRSNAKLDTCQVGRAVLQALVQSGIDLNNGPTLEEVKDLLAEVARQARVDLASGHTAA